MNRNSFVLSNGERVCNDDYATGINGNVIVFGGSGSGKTRGVVIPNLLTCEGSYIVVDLKGSLYKSYARFFKDNGYVVKRLAFSDPKHSNKYNPLEYIENSQDIVALSHSLVKMDDNACDNIDPFWDAMAEYMYNAAIYEVMEKGSFADLLPEIHKKASMNCSERRRFLKDERYSSWGDMMFRNCCAPDTEKTYSSIISVTTSKLVNCASEEINELLTEDEMNLHDIYKEDTIIFVEISDVDFSLNNLANLFINQAIRVLTHDANRYKDSRLPKPVKLILDDMAVSLKIVNLELYLPNTRSKNIQNIMLTQSLSQLKKYYGESANTILANCDTQIFLGGLDKDTNNYFAELHNLPKQQVWDMPLDKCLIFRRGAKNGIYNKKSLDKYLQEHNITIPETTEADIITTSGVNNKSARTFRELAIADGLYKELYDEIHSKIYLDSYNEGYQDAIDEYDYHKRETDDDDF